MEDYPKVWEVAKNIEGIISRRGVHACGSIPINGNPIDHCALMRSPKGDICTQFELHDSEKMGLVKLDLLTTDGLDRIRTCLDLLIKQEYIN